MKCPHCGHKNPPNTVFCEGCDTWILAQVYAEAHPPRKCRPGFSKLPRLLLPLLALSLVAAAVLLALETGDPAPTSQPALSTSLPSVTEPPVTDPPATDPPISFSPGPAIAASDYILRKSDFSYLPIDGSYYVLHNSSLLKLNDELQTYYGLLTCPDGTTGIGLTNNNTIYFFVNDQAVLFDSTTGYPVLSDSGRVFAYRSPYGGIVLHDLDSGTKHTIDVDRWSAASYALSPNGNALVYTDTNLDGESIISYPVSYPVYVYQNGQTVQIAEFPEKVTCLSVSDDGALVYVYVNGSGYYAVTADGTQTYLGTGENFTGSLQLLSTQPHRNTDSTQLLYYHSGGTYLSMNGQPGQKLSDSFLYPVAPKMTAEIPFLESYYIYPHADLRGQVYASRRTVALDAQQDTTLTVSDLYHLDASAGKLTLLATDITEYALDPSGRYLYCLRTGGTLQRIDLADNFHTQVLDTQVDTFAITYNSSLVYYIAANGLYVLQESTSARVRLADAVSTTLYVTADNALHFCQGTVLVSYDPLAGLRQSLTAVTDCQLVPSALLYVTTEAGIYVYLPDTGSWSLVTLPEVEEPYVQSP